MSELSSWSACMLSLVVTALLVTTAGVQAQGWKPHLIRQGDGQGGWILKPAQCQILCYREKGWSAGFGLAQMDNGKVVVLGICAPGKSLWYGGGEDEKTLIAFSNDRGNTWTDLESIPNINGRPMMTAYLGGGDLTFVSGKRYYSSDYGRTWSEGIEVPPASNGASFHTEGNPVVDRDEQGNGVRIAEIGYNFGPGGHWSPQEPEHVFLRWSYDGARTWVDETEPQAWRWEETYQGQTYVRSGDEGALTRAANGWLVAALRTAVPPQFFAWPHSDQYMGTGISISKDNGKTWSPVNILFPAGRMHGHIMTLPNGDLVLTVTVRHDMDDSGLVSYRRGVEAIVSHDNGLTWDLEHKYILDEWEFFDPQSPAIGQCGHLYATLLDDGSILTVHNNYLTMGMTLIRWQP